MRAASPASRGAGVMIVFSPTTIFSPFLSAARTSSSQTKETGFAVSGAKVATIAGGARGAGAKGAGGAEGARGADGAPDAIPRDERNWSMRRVNVSAAIVSAAGLAGACGSRGVPAVPVPDPTVPAPEAFLARTGLISYASRLIFSR